MSVLEHKIDFAVLVTAANANPNGDPLNGNRPRENYGCVHQAEDPEQTAGHGRECVCAVERPCPYR